MSEHEVSMHDLFVSPKIVIKDPKHAENRNSKAKEIRRFSDFFTNDGHRCKNIFLVGEPGSGKSTFIQYFALQWSKLHLLPSPDCSGDCHRGDGFQDQETLSQIEFLFYLSLRDAMITTAVIKTLFKINCYGIYTPRSNKNTPGVLFRVCWSLRLHVSHPTALMSGPIPPKDHVIVLQK